MAKTKQQKQETVGSLARGLKSAKAAVFANFQGLTVAEAEELRNACRKEDIAVVAAKKTLVKRALEEAGLTGVDPETFKGGIATFLAAGDEVSAAKAVQGFAKDHEIVTIFGGILEGKFIAPAAVKMLASMPGKQELLARMVGSLNAPVFGFVNALAGNLRNFVGVLNNIKNAKA